MKWRRLALAAVLVAIVAAVAPAVAADVQTITASNFKFTSATVTIAPGDTVGFANAGGTHNFVFDDGPAYPAAPTAAADPVWSTPPSRTFGQEGAYTFHCGQHGSMTGTITVAAQGGTPTPSPTATPAPSATASPQPTPTATPTPPPRTGAGAVEVRALTRAAASFCVRGCRRPGVRLRIDLSRAADVSGVLLRRPPRGGVARRFGRVDFGTVASGPRTLRFQRAADGRRLKPGRYSLAVKVDGSAVAVVRFTIR